MRPLIGITMTTGDKPEQCAVYSNYCGCIEDAGGVPVAIPYSVGDVLIGEILQQLDGILFSGGDDLDPARWGETRHEKASALHPRREAFEMALIAEVERQRKPVLGICLGCQVLNVHRGGTLHQFLPDLERANPIEHRRLDREWPTHQVKLEEGSVLARAIGKTAFVANTYHKQSVKRVGRGLRVTGHAPDGVVEAIEDPTLPLFVGVQWHPERLRDVPEHLAIFRLLVERARDRA